MNKLLTLMIVLVFIALPFHAIAQDADCDDLEACESLLEESGDAYGELLDDLEDMADENARLHAEVQALIADPPDIPLNGLLQTIPEYRGLPPWAKVTISGGLTALVLGLTVYVQSMQP